MSENPLNSENFSRAAEFISTETLLKFHSVIDVYPDVFRKLLEQLILRALLDGCLCSRKLDDL